MKVLVKTLMYKIYSWNI